MATMSADPHAVGAAAPALPPLPAPAALPSDWPATSLADAHARLTAVGSPFEVVEIDIDGRAQKIWKHAPTTLRELFVAARAYGDKSCVLYEDERASYEGFARASLVIARWLVGRGLVKGDRVALVMRNLPEWMACAYGVTLTGAILTPLNAWWTGPELQYGLTDSGSKFAILDGERLDRLRDHLGNCPALEHLLVSRLPSVSAASSIPLTTVESLIGRAGDWAGLADLPMPDVTIGPEDDATIFYTSGTTGKPKGALGTHRSAALNALHAPFVGARSFLRRGESLPVAKPDAAQKATLLSVPFFHTTGYQAVLNTALFAGVRIVLMRRWNVEQAMQLIERERITSAGGVPTIAWQIVEHPDRERYDLSSLESVSYGGAPAASELVRRIKQVFPKAAPGLGWGMTETTSTFTSHSGEDYINRPESSGPALPLCRMRIVDDQGKDLPPGAVGELWVYGPSVVKGYWQKPQATADTFVDGWLKTGDLCWLDDEGFLFVVDRKKDMLIRGGENIYCIEVESALYDHPAVMDAAVLPIAHKTLGEEPAAIVTLKPGQSVTEEALRAFVTDRIAAFKVPVRILFLDQMLPRNANGKIMKNGLKHLFQTPAADAAPTARVVDLPRNML